VRAYAVNTHAGLFVDTNYDRISIVTNLQAGGSAEKNAKVSFFAVYDGHNGAGCAEFLRDNLHFFLARD
jgi:protein phosphatase 2C family protein 2/3